MDEAASTEPVDVRLATPEDAPVIARLLHDFNLEFDTPTPGPAVIGPRLSGLLDGESTAAILAGDPAVGFAVITLRPNVWYDGPVALLDELYVAPERRDEGIGSKILGLLAEWADRQGVCLIEINVDDSDVDTKRFYRRHGYLDVDPDTGDTASYFYMELRKE